MGDRHCIVFTYSDFRRVGKPGMSGDRPLSCNGNKNVMSRIKTLWVPSSTTTTRNITLIIRPFPYGRITREIVIRIAQ